MKIVVVRDYQYIKHKKEGKKGENGEKRGLRRTFCLGLVVFFGWFLYICRTKKQCYEYKRENRRRTARIENEKGADGA